MSDEYRNTIQERSLAFGVKDRLMSMALLKYPWADDIYETMVSNTWFPKAIGMGDDRQVYRTDLSEKERTAYDRALAFVSNLDGIQFNNLISNIGQCITAPEVSLCIARQAAEEGVHVRAYQLMVEATSLDPENIYMMFARDGLLADKNEYIMRQSDKLKAAPCPASFARAVAGNILLEGVYFYSAFLIFYALARNGKMTASADQIRYINRDEGGTHLELFAHIHQAYKAERPELYDEQFYADVIQMFHEATALEIRWGQYMIQGGVLGLTDKIVELYIKHLANIRIALLGIPPIYPGVTNPVLWVEDFSRVNGGKANFFERKPTDYDVGGGLSWD